MTTATTDPLPDEKRKAMNAKIDAAIAAVEAALRQRTDRRGAVEQHNPEQRSGFDRRTRSSPAKD